MFGVLDCVHKATDNQMVIPVGSALSMQPMPPSPSLDCRFASKNMMHSLHLTDEGLSTSANVQLFQNLMELARRA